MTVAHDNPKYTIEDYMRLPEGTPVELIGGELLVSPAPRFRHQRILGRLFRSLAQWVEDRGLGEVVVAPCDVVLSKHDVVQPDILFVSNERKGIITELNLQGAPDFIVEILSPGTEKRDAVSKKELYERHGVKEYWIVDPSEETVEVLILEQEEFVSRGVLSKVDAVESVVLAGFRLPLASVFRSATSGYL